MKLFKLIERNMRRNLRRTLMTILTIALAAFVYTILVSVPASMDRVVNEATGTLRLVVVNKTAPWEDLPARYCDEIRELPGAAACVGFTGWFATWRNPSEPVFAVAFGPQIRQVFPDYQLSPELQKLMDKERRSAVVGPVLRAKYGWKVGDQITLRGTDAQHMELPFVIMGVTPTTRYPNVFLFRRDYLMAARKANGLGDDDIAWQLFVRADGPTALAPLAKEIDDHFRNSDYETRSTTESDALASGLSSIGNIRAIIFSLIAVVILTVLLIAANSTAMMVRDRISEVAVMRALGFSRIALAGILFGECFAIGLIGGAIGAGLALKMFYGGVTLGAVLNGNGALWVTPAQAAGAVTVAAIVCLISGLVPIIEALRIPPALAFRQVV
jgi:putative ABC transport system permease protein